MQYGIRRIQGSGKFAQLTAQSDSHWGSAGVASRLSSLVCDSGHGTGHTHDTTHLRTLFTAC